MRTNSQRNCYLVALLGVVLGVAMYLLLYYGACVECSTNFFVLMILAGTVLAAALLLANVLAQNQKDLREAYCCCGNLSMIGGVGLILTSAFASFVAGYICIFGRILISLIVFFLTVQLGGLACFLYKYNKCRRRCVCCICTSEDEG